MNGKPKVLLVDDETGILDTLQDELKRRYKDDPTLALN